MDGDVGLGLKWNAVSVVLVRVLGAIRSITIARLLGPELTGRFAGAMAFVTLATLAADFGLQSFLMQRGARAKTAAVPVGQLAIVTGVIAAGALAIAAQPIANLYDEPQVARITLALTGAVVLTALSIVPAALLRTEFRFDAVARAAVLAEVAASVVGIGLAVAYNSVWALVGAALAGPLVLTAMLFASRPTWERSPTEHRTNRRDALRFGANLTAGSAVWTFALHGDNVIVGQALGATALGLYAFAYNYGIMPGGIIGSTVTDVALTSLSAAGSDTERRKLFTHFVRVGAAASAPLVGAAFALAPSGTRLVLGSTWEGAMRPLQVLLVVGFLRGVLPTEALLRSRGRVRVELFVGLAAAPATLAAAWLSADSGLFAVALSVGAVLSTASMGATAVGVRPIGLSLRHVAAALLPSALVSAAFAAGLLAIDYFAPVPDVAMVLLLGPAALAANFFAIRQFLPNEWRSLTEVAAARRQRAGSETSRR